MPQLGVATVGLAAADGSAVRPGSHAGCAAGQPGGGAVVEPGGGAAVAGRHGAWAALPAPGSGCRARRRRAGGDLVAARGAGARAASPLPWPPERVGPAAALLGVLLLLLPRGVPGRWSAWCCGCRCCSRARPAAARRARTGGVRRGAGAVGAGPHRATQPALRHGPGDARRLRCRRNARWCPRCTALGVRRARRGGAQPRRQRPCRRLRGRCRARFRSRRSLAPEGCPAPGIVPCRAGQSWQWDGVRFRVLHPPAWFPYLGNEASCVLRIETAHGTALLTGDIGAADRGEAAARRPRVDCAPTWCWCRTTAARLVDRGLRRRHRRAAGAGVGRRRQPLRPSDAAGGPALVRGRCARSSRYRPRRRDPHRGIGPRTACSGSERRGLAQPRLWDASGDGAMGRLGYRYAPDDADGHRGPEDLTRAGTGQGRWLADDPVCCCCRRSRWRSSWNASGACAARRVLPPRLGEEVREWAARGKPLDPAHIDSLRAELAAGRAAGRRAGRAPPSARAGPRPRRGRRPAPGARHGAFLNTLGTIAADRRRCWACSAPWSA